MDENQRKRNLRRGALKALMKHLNRNVLSPDDVSDRDSDEFRLIAPRMASKFGRKAKKPAPASDTSDLDLGDLDSVPAIDLE